MGILIRDELYKILSQKVIYLAASFFMLLQILHYFSDNNDSRADIRQLQELMLTYGGSYTADHTVWGASIHDTYAASTKPKPNETPSADQAALANMNRIANEIMNIQSRLKHFEQALTHVSTALASSDPVMDKRALTNSLRNLNHLLRVERTVLLQDGWNKLLQYQNSVGYVFAASLMILGTATMYTRETSSRVIALLLTTRHGRIRLALAKCCAASLYAAIVIVFFALAVLIAHWYQYGMVNGDAPLYNLHNLYGQTDFDGSILQFFTLQQLYAFGGCTALAWLMILLSTLSSRSAIPVFIGGAILMLPITVSLLHLPVIPLITTFLALIPYTELIQLDHLADSFYVNLVGISVSYRLHAILLISLYLVLPLCLLLWRIQRREAL